MPHNTLAPCPKSPNCVSSEAEADSHYIEPYVPKGNPQKAWRALQTVLNKMPRTVIKTADDQYIRAESKSRWFGFVDDVEFVLQPQKNRIAIRSASRTGYSDLGVNRKRLEGIRQRLQIQGLIR